MNKAIYNDLHLSPEGALRYKVAGWEQEHHDKLDKLSDGKLIALGECGSLPKHEQLRKQNRFALFTIWTAFTRIEYNSPEDIKAVFDMPEVICR